MMASYSASERIAKKYGCGDEYGGPEWIPSKVHYVLQSVRTEVRSGLLRDSILRRDQHGSHTFADTT
jgi:hypothetical protein